MKKLFAFILFLVPFAVFGVGQAVTVQQDVNHVGTFNTAGVTSYVMPQPITFQSATFNTVPVYQTVVNIAALRATRITAAVLNGYAVQVTGYYTANDGGGGVYVWNSTSVATDNGGTVIQPTGVTSGRWLLQVIGMLNVRQFGAMGNGSSNDVTAIQNAIDTAYAASGGKVFMPPGVYAVGSTIKLKPGVILIGSGDGDFSNPTVTPTQIKPSATFSATDVVRCDPADIGTGSAYVSGVSMRDLAIDMTNVATASKIALHLLSVSNAGPWQNISILNQDSGQYVYIGQSANATAIASDGMSFIDFYTLSKTISPANTDPSIIIEQANEITFMGGRTKIQRKNQGVAGSVGILIRTNGLQGVNAVTLDGISVAGYETHIKTDWVSGVDQGPRWIRVVNCTFEGYRFGVSLTGGTVGLGRGSQFCLIGPGNRFITPQGSSPAAIVADFAANCTIIPDEFATSAGVTLTANSQSITVMGQPSGVTNSSTTNLVYGRGASAESMVVKSGLLTLLDANLQRIGAGQIQLTGATTPLFRFLSTNTTDTSIVDSLVSGEGNTRFAILKSGLMKWGPGGATASDTNFYRSSVGTLKTDNNLTVNGILSTGSAGPVLTTTVSATNGAGALTATMTNSPVTGNPTKWIAINDNGTTRYIPTW